MDELVVMAGLALLAIPVAFIALLVVVLGQKRRLERVEHALEAMRDEVASLRRRAREADETPAADSLPSEAADVQQAATITAPIPSEDPVAAIPPPLPSSRRPFSSRPVSPPSPIADALSKFGPWLQENWFYAVSAVSLALAGIFLVQYGMDNGLLPPRARVVAALAFGAGLIGVGEFIRRRFGDGSETVTAYLPSVFSGAGVVTLFGAVLSARMLYELIGAAESMIGMVVVALVALVLGWAHGPLLAAIGVIGAYWAPVVLGSPQSDASPLYAYFTIIAVLGLGVDTIRRWGWISALSLVLGYLCGWGLLLDDESLAWAAIAYFTMLAALSIMIPARGVRPDHKGTTVVEALFVPISEAPGKVDRRPQFPTLLAFGAVVATSLSLMPMVQLDEAEVWLSMMCLAGLAVVITFWSLRARALQDVAMMPALVLLGSVFAQGAGYAATYRVFRSTYADNLEAGFPWTITALVLLGALISVSAAWRSLQGGRLQVAWAAVAAVYAPVLAILLEVSWSPAAVVGAYPWALHAAGLAALMVVLADRFARVDGAVRLRVSFAVMSALSCMSFAFVIVLSSAALTVALAVTVVVAAVLDRRWNLPPMSYFISVGVVTLGYRLVIDPGLKVGRYGPLGEMMLVYAGTLGAFIAALWLLQSRDRVLARTMLESAAWSTGGILASLLFFRWIDRFAPVGTDGSHWSLGIMASIWLGLALAQIQRATIGGTLALVWRGLAAFFALIGAGALWMGVTEANPVLHAGATAHVFGPPLINTLAVAYVLPAVVLLAGAWRLVLIDRGLRLGLVGIGVALIGLWVVLVIRHFWQGGEAMHLDHGVGQPELYSYTIALLIVGAALFYQSLAARAASMRRAGLVVIGLAVAKVFLIDISGLGGLTRVFSLLVLGLSLAALAWLNRWAQAHDAQNGPKVRGRPPVLRNDLPDI